MKKKKRLKKVFLSYVVIAIIGIVLLYPIIWMFFASFKTNDEIFGSTRRSEEHTSELQSQR